MILRLTRFPLSLVEGAYRVRGDDTAMPDRARMLETGACADSFARHLAAYVVVSDMLRTPESSLAAMQRKSGVQPPSFSHHNYGRAIDLEVGPTIKRMKATYLERSPAVLADGAPVRDKRTLDLWMAERGWYCYRGDHKTGKSDDHPNDESWHYDFLGDLPENARPRYPYKNERKIAWAACQARYAEAWALTIRFLGSSITSERVDAAKTCQAMLKDRGFYHGAVDGLVGPQTRAAIGALQRAWHVPETCRLDPRTVQVLTFVCAEKVVTDMVEATDATNEDRMNPATNEDPGPN